MSLIAKDEHGETIFAPRGNKQTDYFCLECGGALHIRLGEIRKPHFYHLADSKSCNQSGKSLTHLQIQYYLLESLPEGEVTLEHRFERGRIADVFWKNQKTVFEIQCSKISPQEVREREEDYSKEGLKIVWILHDSLFNQKMLTGGELALDKTPHYFTNIDSEKKGIIYDQISIVRLRKRVHRLSKLEIDLKRPYSPTLNSSPSLIHFREKNWPLGFQGDWMSLWQREDLKKELLRFESKEIPLFTLFKKISSSYKGFIQLLLEGACR